MEVLSSSMLQLYKEQVHLMFEVVMVAVLQVEAEVEEYSQFT